MELLPYSLHHAIQEKIIDNEEEVYQVVLDITEGLVYLHGKDIIHRDIKPSNVLVSFSSYKIRRVILYNLNSKTIMNRYQSIHTEQLSSLRWYHK